MEIELKKIGILGGSFDPVHIGHISIAEAASKSLNLDFVIFMPASHSPLKDTCKASNEHRLEMLRISTSHRTDFIVSDFEIKKGGKSYTFETAEYLKKIYIDDELFFILGDEAYKDLPNWKNPHRISACFNFAVVTRDELDFTEGIHYIKIKPISVSSTKIRKRLIEGKDCSNMLDSNVLHYIEKNGLYKE